MKEELREKFISLQSFEDEKSYRESPSLNYSTLKLIPEGPRCLVADKYEKKGSALTIGDYVDKFFTDKELWRETYDTERRSIKLSESLETLYAKFVEERNYSPSMTQCVELSRRLGLWSLFSDAKIAERITADFFSKLERAGETESKVILSPAEYDKAMSSIGNIRGCGAAMRLITEDEDSIIIPQFKWEFEYQIPNGEIRKFRVMFDFLKFLLNERRIIGIDIKSGGLPSIKFGRQFIDYRYDIQGLLYHLGMEALIREHFPEWNIPTLEDFKFLYSPKIADSEPIIVSMDENFVSKFCYRLKYDGKVVDGFWKILEDTDWYLANEQFEMHRIIAEDSHEISIMKLLS